MPHDQSIIKKNESISNKHIDKPKRRYVPIYKKHNLCFSGGSNKHRRIEMTKYHKYNTKKEALNSEKNWRSIVDDYDNS